MTGKSNNINNKIGLKIKLMRNKIGISQEELGYRAGLNKNSIGSIERGESSPTIDTLISIANALNTTIVDIVDTTKIEL